MKRISCYYRLKGNSLIILFTFAFFSGSYISGTDSDRQGPKWYVTLPYQPSETATAMLTILAHTVVKWNIRPTQFAYFNNFVNSQWEAIFDIDISYVLVVPVFSADIYSSIFATLNLICVNAEHQPLFSDVPFIIYYIYLKSFDSLALYPHSHINRISREGTT